MNNWQVFYVASYKGGELMKYKDISEEDVVAIVADSIYGCMYYGTAELTLNG